MTPADVMIGWTTTTRRDDAERLARGLVEGGVVACVQISGPILSIYRWHGAIESTEEFRLTMKFATTREAELSRWLAEHHPYESPQWVACAMDAGMEKYLKWVVDSSS